MNRGTKLVLVFLLMGLSLACALPELPFPTAVPTATPRPTSVPGITAKEALRAGWEAASAEFGTERLYLWEARNESHLFRKGHGVIEDGRDNDWDVNFKRVNSAETQYTLVLVWVRDSQVEKCLETGSPLKWFPGSLESELVDLSEEDWQSWIDSPEAVERALAVAEEQGIPGLGAMTLILTRCSGYGSRPPCYHVNLGPVSGEGGKGLRVWIAADTGELYHVEEMEWQPAIGWHSGAD